MAVISSHFSKCFWISCFRMTSAFNLLHPTRQCLEIGEVHARQACTQLPRIEPADHIPGQITGIKPVPENALITC